jgi:hypothetical protein
MKTRLYVLRYAFNMDYMDSGNRNKAKLIRLDPLLNFIGTSRGSNAERYLVIFQRCWIIRYISGQIYSL